MRIRERKFEKLLERFNWVLFPRRTAFMPRGGKVEAGRSGKAGVHGEIVEFLEQF